MRVIYRITSIPSTNPSPIYQENKDELNAFCLRSFVSAFVDIKPKIHFIMDFCPPEYDSMVETYVPWPCEIEHTQLGINGTMLRSYELARQYDDYVLLQECDYVYRPHTGGLLLEAIKQLGLVSPYDHLNFYLDRNLHSERCKIRLVEGHHFRTTERNTMTWGAESSFFSTYYDILTRYGYLDGDVWYDLRDMGDEELWVPIPSIATHMASGWLSPGIKWEEQWQSLIQSS